MLNENRIDEDSRIYQEIRSHVLSSERYTEAIKDKLTNKAIAELLDISELQEVIEFYEEYIRGESDCYLYDPEDYEEDFDKNFTFIE